MSHMHFVSICLTVQSAVLLLRDRLCRQRGSRELVSMRMPLFGTRLRSPSSLEIGMRLPEHYERDPDPETICFRYVLFKNTKTET